MYWQRNQNDLQILEQTQFRRETISKTSSYSRLTNSTFTYGEPELPNYLKHNFLFAIKTLYHHSSSEEREQPSHTTPYSYVIRITNDVQFEDVQPLTGSSTPASRYCQTQANTSGGTELT